MKKESMKPFFWSWDHSTNWKKNEYGKQVCGANNPYTKKPEAFLDDYKRLITWSAEHGVDTVGVAGLLRDGHGGIETARYITDYAKDKGVTLYEICGLAAYNGVYYEGDSEWCLDNFLRDNPDCLALDKDGNPIVRDCGFDSPKIIRHACVSNQKMIDYINRSLEWLFKTLPSLGGISIETGDTGACQCAECQKRRPFYEERISTADMALVFPKAVETIRSVKPDALVICETYEHFLPFKNPNSDIYVFGWGLNDEQLEQVSQIPKDVYISWVADMCLDQWNETHTMPEILKDHHHIMRAHYGTQWLASTRHKLELDKIRKMCFLSQKAEFDAVSLFSESSVFNTNNELNYLAEIYFAQNPFDTVDDFLKNVAADILGGYDAATEWYRINQKIDNDTVTMDDSSKAVKYANEFSGETKRRWIWLSSYSASFCWDKNGINV